MAEKGVGFVAAADQHAFLATTGKPELKAGNNLGTPRPIRVTKRHECSSFCIPDIAH